MGGKRCSLPSRTTPRGAGSPAGHRARGAVRQEALAGFAGSILICYGDMPLMCRETGEALFAAHQAAGNDCTLLTAVSDEELPTGVSSAGRTATSPHIVEDRTAPRRKRRCRG